MNSWKGFLIVVAAIAAIAVVLGSFFDAFATLSSAEYGFGFGDEPWEHFIFIIPLVFQFIATWFWLRKRGPGIPLVIAAVAFFPWVVSWVYSPSSWYKYLITPTALLLVYIALTVWFGYRWRHLR